MSPLARLLREKKKAKSDRILLPEAPDEDCNTKTWSKRTICEEARLNPEAQNYVTTQKLTILQGQARFVKAGNTFQFPAPGVEVKADWIELPACANPPQGVHVETVNSVCYALGGIHLTSRLIDKWVWATFELQNDVTNPQRCVVLECRDKWGSNPATTSGAATQLNPSLSDLTTQANLAPEWKNYRLDGVQIDYLDADGKPTRLGNSIIEGDNAGNPAKMNESLLLHHLSRPLHASPSWPAAHQPKFRHRHPRPDPRRLRPAGLRLVPIPGPLIDAYPRHPGADGTSHRASALGRASVAPLHHPAPKRIPTVASDSGKPTARLAPCRNKPPVASASFVPVTSRQAMYQNARPTSQ
jgi:hypothetical protein